MSPVELAVRLLVVAGIFAVSMFLLRRYAARQVARPATTPDGFRVLSRMSLGKGSQVLLLESGGKTFVVGVGQAQVLQVGNPASSFPPSHLPDDQTAATQRSIVEADPATDSSQPSVTVPSATRPLDFTRRFAQWLGFVRPLTTQGSRAPLGASPAFADVMSTALASRHEQAPSGVLEAEEHSKTEGPQTPATSQQASLQAGPQPVKRASRAPRPTKGTAKSPGRKSRPVTGKAAPQGRAQRPPAGKAKPPAQAERTVEDIARHYNELLIDAEELSRAR